MAVTVARTKTRVYSGPRRGGDKYIYTTPPGGLLSVLPISTLVASGEPHPLLRVGSTGVRDTGSPDLRGRRSRLNASFNIFDRERRRIVESTRRTFKASMLLKRLKSVLASNMVQIHHDISTIVIKSTTPTGSLVHNPLPNISASRPKAERNAIALWNNDVRPTDLVTITNLSRLTPRAATNTVSCTGSQEFRTRGHCEGDFGDTCPIAEKASVH